MYDSILLPTDGSEASLVAVDEGLALARQSDATVHLLHVVDVGIEMSASGVGTIADQLTETLSSIADEALDAAERRAADAGVDYTRTVREGDPIDSILAASDERDADLVVIGASGHSGLKDQLLGTTADRVAQRADVSVLIARP